ncbi:MAG: polysaccharide pyruvyl transferase CsaB [Clostridia bacterium]|nr:polysaccharide pyruvyl transferase CsaB [Clostridia bacterium]
MKALLVLMGMEIGGAETHVLELSAALKSRGVEVLIASNGGIYTNELEKMGIKHYNLPLHNKKIGNMIKSYFGLKKIIKTEKPDVVHGHARIPSFILGLLNKTMGFNFVTTAHWVFDTSGILKYVTNWGYRTVAVSEDIKTYLIDNYNVPSQDITVTINGINTEKFAPGQDKKAIIAELGLKEDTIKIVYISRLDESRSLVAKHLLDVADDIKEKHNVEIIIVGGGDDMNNIEAITYEVNKKAENKFVFLTGARTDIDRFVALADVFIGVSRSALEAMSGAVPVIVAGNEGYIGIFDEDKLDDCISTNFCCRGMEASSPQRLLKDVLSVLEMNDEEKSRIGTYGRNIILKHYSVDKMAEDNLMVYNDIISHGNKGVDIVLSGYYGHNNNGDEALLGAILEEISKKRKGTRFTVLSKRPKLTSKQHGVKSVNRFNIFKVYSAIKNCRLLLSGGGSLIQDATSTKSLFYYTHVIKLALSKKKKVFVYANGIGPVNKEYNQKIASKVLNEVDYITLRDDKSVEVLENIGVTQPEIEVTADPAVSVSPVNLERVIEIFEKEKIVPNEYFAVSMRQWEDTDVTWQISRICDYVSHKYGLTAVFIPMQNPDDMEISQKCISRMEKEGYVLKGEYDYRDIMGICANSKFVLSMRLHALMYGANSGIPVIGLGYDPKVEAYLRYMQHSFMTDINNLSYDSVVKMVDEIMENYEDISAKLKDRGAFMREKAKRNPEIACELLGGTDENIRS